MDAKDFVTALERFFLDIVGVIAPGLALLAGAWFFLGRPALPTAASMGAPWSWLLPLLAAYASGHVANSLGRWPVLPLAQGVCNLLQKLPLLADRMKWIEPENQLFQRVQNSKIFKAFVERMRPELPELADESQPKDNVRQWRNVAITIVQDQSQLVYRATFIAAFNLGMATACFLVGAFWIGSRLVGRLETAGLPGAWWGIALFVAFLAFLERHYYFYSIAIRLPFSMALTQMAIKNPAQGAT